MEKSNRENEIKLAFPSPDDAVSKLLAIGARPHHPRSFEDNVLFDLAGRPLTSSGRILRLREFGGASILTFKGPVAGHHRHKVKIEHETPVASAEAMRSILLGLGYEIVYRYQKYRATYTVAGVEAAVDETSLGTFVELEGPPDEVDHAAAALGASPGDYIRLSYRELQEKDAAERGLVPGDLLFVPPRGRDTT